MSRRLALVALVALAATAASAAPGQQYRYTYKGDGFDAQLWNSDECRSVSVYLYGADQYFKAGPGQPATSNYAFADAYVENWCTQSQGWAWLDLTDVVSNARGPNATTTASGSFEIPMGHWVEGTEEVCESYEEQCFDDNWNFCDCAGECTYEYPAGEWCYIPSTWVDEGTATMGFNLTLTPDGTVYRGMSNWGSKSKSGMYRSRSVGTFRQAIISGTWVLDGQDLMASGGSYGNLWNTNGGEMSIWRY